MSDCAALEDLYCAYNRIAFLDVSHNVELKYLTCHNNNLTSMELYKNPKIEELSFEPQASFDVVPYHRLVNGEIQYFLYLNDEGDGNAQSLKNAIRAHEGADTDPDIAFDPQYVADWGGATIDGNVLILNGSSGSLTYSYATHSANPYENGQLAPVTLTWSTSRPLTRGTIPIDEEHFPDDGMRSWARGYYNDGYDYLDDVMAASVTQLQVNRYSQTTEIHFDANNLTGIEYFPNLNRILIAGTITKLDLSKNTKLATLMMSGNGLTSIDLSKNAELTSLMITNNSITALDLSHNSKLKSLRCDANLLTSLDLSHNPEISSVQASPQRSSTIVPYRRVVNGQTQYFLFLSDATKGPNQSLADMIHKLEGENVDDAIRFDISRASDWGGDCSVDGDILVLGGESGTLTYNYATGSNAGAVEFTLSWTESREAEATGMRGDANGDGKVNVTDVVTTANYVLGLNPSPFVFANADVTGDGKVNVTDLVGIVNITLEE